MSNEQVQVRPEGQFAVASVDAAEHIAAALALGVGTFQLPKIKAPTGGGLLFEMQTSAGVQGANLIDVVIAHVNAKQKAWWAVPLDEGGGGTPPNCASRDGVHGFGNPTLAQDEKMNGAHECIACPWNQFKSARGKSKAGKDCRDFAQLFVFRQNSRVPTVVTVPPTSLKSMTEYLVKLMDDGLDYRGVVTRLSLLKAKGASAEYAVMQFTQVARLSADEYARVKGVGQEILTKVVGSAPSIVNASDLR